MAEQFRIFDNASQLTIERIPGNPEYEWRFAAIYLLLFLFSLAAIKFFTYEVSFSSFWVLSIIFALGYFVGFSFRKTKRNRECVYVFDKDAEIVMKNGAIVCNLREIAEVGTEIQSRHAAVRIHLKSGNSFLLEKNIAAEEARNLSHLINALIQDSAAQP